MFGRGYPVFSFEFFPPKTEEGIPVLQQTIRDLVALRPSFCSVTYGAGGGTRERTVDLVCFIKNNLRVEAMMHLTCVGHSRDELRRILDNARDRGIENVIALRGDPPKDQKVTGHNREIMVADYQPKDALRGDPPKDQKVTGHNREIVVADYQPKEFKPHPDGFRYAAELVSLAHSYGCFCICVAGYPEGHVECPDKEEDLRHLKEKVDAGGEVIITQLFFDNRDYFNFVERARALGIQTPIVPGILPILSVKQIKRFTQLCGAKIPADLEEKLRQVETDDEAAAQVGIEHATRQCRELLERGAPGIHFYVLNKARSVKAIFYNLGLARKAAT